MRFLFTRSDRYFWRFHLSALGCSGSSLSQPPGDLPAAVAARQSGLGAWQAAAPSSRDARRFGGRGKRFSNYMVTLFGIRQKWSFL